MTIFAIGTICHFGHAFSVGTETKSPIHVQRMVYECRRQVRVILHFDGIHEIIMLVTPQFADVKKSTRKIICHLTFFFFAVLFIRPFDHLYCAECPCWSFFGHSKIKGGRTKRKNTLPFDLVNTIHWNIFLLSLFLLFHATNAIKMYLVADKMDIKSECFAKQQ